MTNLSNLTTFINNFLRNPQLKPASTFVPPESGAPPAGQKLIAQAPMPAFKTNQAILDTSLAMAQMSAKERAVIVKEFLNLPDDLNELVKTVQTLSGQGAAQTQKSGITLSQLDIAALMTLFQTNGKAAQEKIFQFISFLKQQGNIDTKQFQELHSIINLCIPMPGTTQAQFLKNLILLYLPWLPVGEQNNFDIEFKENDEGESASGLADDTVTILIKTKNFGNVRVTLMLVNSHKVEMLINCSKEFPKESLEEVLKRDCEGYSMQTGIEFEEQEVSKDEPANDTKVHMNTSPKLSPYLLLASHSVIRAVIEIDKSASLVSERSKKI